jgi:predicted Rdx family selenoprotein
MGSIEEYSEVITRLVTEIVCCVPAEWTHGTLAIESDGVQIEYRLKAEDQPGAAMISEKLRDLIDELYVHMARQGNVWVEAIVSFTRQNGTVSFNTSFRHDEAPTSPAPAKRPWWRFGASRA